MKIQYSLFLVFAIFLTGCATGSRVVTGPNRYPRVPTEDVQILFTPPSQPFFEIGIATAQGAQLATDATVFEEVRSQAAKLGADAVIIAGQDRRAYATLPGFVNVSQNTTSQGSTDFRGSAYASSPTPYSTSVYGSGQATYQGSSMTQTSGVISGPSTYEGTHVTGIAIKFK